MKRYVATALIVLLMGVMIGSFVIAQAYATSNPSAYLAGCAPIGGGKQECIGTASKGLSPYYPYWKRNNDPWVRVGGPSLGPFYKVYHDCGPRDMIYFKVQDSAGLWSNVGVSECEPPPTRPDLPDPTSTAWWLTSTPTWHTPTFQPPTTTPWW
jgi:hypothetical protein